ncbi:urea ABC transporter, permease protein UrtB [Agrilactobacillus composti DSM 18527 = JCM 14202]|nr:urea ABC transporter permease subunit UrtB [Agrilactobacillus composti]GAF38346.1 urea ABC transporter, permease protein UrtB [Agrilactobacillus composti DSM 18527 = JCM 14202]
MSTVIMQLFNGISVGSILLLAAVGLTITFGLMGIINMAHGEFIMIGAYTTYVVQLIFQKYFPGGFSAYVLVALVLSFLITALLGYLLEKIIIRYLYDRPEDSLLVTWGLSLILQQLARNIFGAPDVSVTSPKFLQGNVAIGANIDLPINRLAILAIAILALGGVAYLLFRTKFGRNINATMQNRQMAAALGINTKRIDSLTFALGTGLAGLAGCAVTWIGSIGPSIGQDYIINAFITVVVGGAGTLLGTIFGSTFMGVGNTTLEYLTNPSIGQALVLILVIIILQFKPKGVFSLNSRKIDD